MFKLSENSAKNGLYMKVKDNLLAIVKKSIITLIGIKIFEAYNIFSIITNLKISGSLYILAFIFLVAVAYELKIHSFLFFRIYNYLDSILIYSILTLFGYLMIGIVDKSSTNTIIFWILIILVVIEVARMCFITISSYRMKFSKKQCELFDLYSNSDQVSAHKFILIVDNPSNIDLLHRDFIISNLYDSIVSSYTEEKFIINLEGVWGSGKTTIINIVKGLLEENNKDEIIVIDDFDPWIFSDRSSMLLNMFDKILIKTSVRPSFLSAKMFLSVIKNVIFNTKFGESFKVLGSNLNEENTNINRIRKDIDDYLSVSGKKVVFFIDNIDRAEKENIKLLFKLIHSVLGFNKIIYVLAFDEKIVCDILDEDYYNGSEFLKKLIQMQIKIPPISSVVMNELINRTTTNLMKSYGYSNEINSLIGGISFYPNLIGNIRDFILFLNSVITSNFRSKNYLNVIDKLGIKLINFDNNELFMEIYNNPKYFISFDKSFELGISLLEDKNILNQKAKLYFESLFSSSKNNKYKDLLSIMFPSVKRYLENKEIFVESNVLPVETRKESYERNKGRRISSGKFFALYFTDITNEFIYVHEEIESLIKEEERTDTNTFAYEFRNLLFGHKQEQVTKIVLETLNYYIEEISLNIIDQFLLVLTDAFYEFNDLNEPYNLSNKERAAALISELLLRLDISTFSKYVDEVALSIGNIGMLGSLQYWINSHYKNEGVMTNKKNVHITQVFKHLGIHIIENELNIFKDDYYHKNNSSGLYQSLKLSEETSRLPEYTKQILDENNVFRFLFDLMTVSNSTKGRKYSLKKESIDLFTTIEVVDQVISDATQINQDEEYIKEIYMLSRAGEKDEWGHELGKFNDNFTPDL